MKYIALAFALMFSTASYAADCSSSRTQEEFLAFVATQNDVVFMITKDKQAAFKTQLAIQLKPTVPYPETAVAYWARLSPESYGVVLFDNGCVVQDTAKVISLEQMKSLLKEAEIDSKDILSEKVQ